MSDTELTRGYYISRLLLAIGCLSGAAWVVIGDPCFGCGGIQGFGPGAQDAVMQTQLTAIEYGTYAILGVLLVAVLAHEVWVWRLS